MAGDMVVAFRQELDRMAPVLTVQALAKAQERISAGQGTERFLEDLRAAHAEFSARGKLVEPARVVALGDENPHGPEARRLKLAASEEIARTINARAQLERLIRAAGSQVKDAQRKTRQRRMSESPVPVLRAITKVSCGCGCREIAQKWLDEYTAARAR
jgi:hypothetical protein